jgi:hypothetical protein
MVLPPLLHFFCSLDLLLLPGRKILSSALEILPVAPLLYMPAKSAKDSEVMETKFRPELLG